MTAPDPQPATAADLLVTAERIRTAVRAGAGGPAIVWLVGMAVASLMYLAALGTTTSQAAVLVVSGAFAACVAGLSLGLLPGLRASKHGFPVRFGVAVGVWGLAFGLALGLGLALFPGRPLFWLPAAALTSLPLVLGARAEAAA